MKEENKTEVILQKIANGINNLETKLIKGATAEVKSPKKTKSLYDTILDNLNKENRTGGNIDERRK